MVHRGRHAAGAATSYSLTVRRLGACWASRLPLREVAAAVTASAAPHGPPPPEELRTALRAAVARHAHADR
ncbi:hypothetical protein ABZ467_34635 [Streptomyces sp. NPDC005727]|uniref:hypothetical protein n=1 Tax=Streptomyces sp. NPDC005727 TaxID=3157053 RepID=UPI0033C2F682